MKAHKLSIDAKQKEKEQGTFLLLIGILLFASNLRAPITSVGSLVPAIRDGLDLSNAVIGIITTLPLLAFAIISPFAPKIANRFGMEKIIFFSMIVLLLGMIIRSITGVGTLFIGTALIGIAIAFGNVLLPGFIKMSFPLQIGLITGLYTVTMNVFGGLASGFSVPLANIDYVGWQGALAAWAILVVIALIVWLPQLHKSTHTSKSGHNRNQEKTNMWTSFTAWQITIFMGFQSLMFYTPITWLPEILQSNGYSPAEAGWMISLMQFSLIPTTFIIPIIADKMKSQKILGAFTGVVFILGVAGLLSGSTSLIVISIILLGIGCGSGFSLSMMFFTLRTKDGYAASELSGMAQSVGYLLAAFGPVLFGVLHDLTGNWTVPLFLLLIISIVILIAGWLGGRQVTIK